MAMVNSVFMVTLAMLALASPSTAGEPKTDDARLTCTPRVGIAGYKVQLKVRVYNPVKLYCPHMTIEWPDDTRTIRESDCEPLEAGEIGDDFTPDSFFFRAYGPLTIGVRLKAGKHERYLTCQVDGKGAE